MTHNEGTLYWNLEEIRLAPGVGLMCGQYFGQNGDDYSANLTTRTPEEFEFVKSKLREFSVTEISAGVHEFNWCTFRGIVRGSAPEPGDATYLSRWPVWHRKNPAMEMLREIEVFWNQSQFDEASPLLSKQLAQVQVSNPFLQDGESVLRFDMLMKIGRDRSQDYPESQGFGVPPPAQAVPELNVPVLARSRSSKP